MERVLRVIDPAGATPHELPELPPEVVGAIVPETTPSPAPHEAYQKKTVEELFDMALNGQIPRGRELKTGEPESLSPQHLQWVLMRSMGFKPGQIVQQEILQGRPVTLNRVSVILNHPDSQFLLHRLMSYRAENHIGDVSERIRAHAHELVDIALHHARNVKKENASRQSVFDLLKMGGYGAVEKKQVEHSFSLPAAQANQLTGAIQEASALRQRRIETLEVGTAGSDNATEFRHLGSGRPPSQFQQLPTSQEG